MDDDEGRVEDLLEQCVDHAALRLSAEPSDALDADLLARLERLKAAPLAPTTRVDADGLQSDLAQRLAALKKNPSKKDPSKAPAPEIIKTARLQSDFTERLAALKKDPSKSPESEIINTAKLSNPNRIVKEMHEGDAYKVEKLLESVHDCVRLEKSGASKSKHNNDSDEEVSDSEVDHIVEWAKDAALLEEDEEDEASDVDLPTTPTTAHSPQIKKKGSRWKFW